MISFRKDRGLRPAALIAHIFSVEAVAAVPEPKKKGRGDPSLYLWASGAFVADPVSALVIARGYPFLRGSILHHLAGRRTP